MMGKMICAVFLIFIYLSANAQTELEKKSSIAGRYLGVIILADEFSKTNCGKSANLGDRYTNVHNAIRQVKSKFSSVSKVELDMTFSDIEIQKQRQEMVALLTTMKLEKCDEAKRTLLPFFDAEIRKWEAVK